MKATFCGRLAIGLLIGLLAVARLQADLTYSTYLGGEGDESATSVTSDASGNIYILGTTTSNSWLTNSADATIFTVVANPTQGIFVLKLDGASHALRYKAIIAGDGSDVPTGMVIDAQGRAIIAGSSTSLQFPGVAGPVPPGTNIFLLRLAADGKSLIDSRFIGGAGDDTVTAFAADASGKLVMGGVTDSEDFPAGQTGSGRQLFILELSADTSTVLFSKTFTTGADSQVTCLTSAGNGFIYMAGENEAGGTSAFIGKIRLATGDLQSRTVSYGSATFIQSMGMRGSDIVIGGSKAGGDTQTFGGFDGLFGVYHDDLSVSSDPFVFGGSQFDRVNAFVLDAQGNVWATGQTASRDLPTSSNALETSSPSLTGSSAFVAGNIVPTAIGPVPYLSYLGSSGLDSGVAIAAGAGRFFVVGNTRPIAQLPQFPTTASAFQNQFGGGGGDVFLSEITAVNSAPENDAFASAAALAGSVLTVVADTSLATRESGEPMHAGALGSASVWWSWTAPRTGDVVVTTRGSAFDTLLAVYTNSTLASLAVIASNNNDGTNVTSWLTFKAVEGGVYKIAVDGAGTQKGSVVLSLSMYIPPNDDFVHATEITGLPVVTSGSNTNATREAGEPIMIVDPYGAHSSIWFQWTAPATQKIRVDTTGSAFDGLVSVGVFRGDSLLTLQRVGYNNDNNLSSFVFSAEQGVKYYILADGQRQYPYDAPTVFGQVALALTPASAPPNDDFTNRIDLTASPLPIHITSTVTDASREFDETLTTYAQAGRTVWWSWTPPHTGVFTFKAKGTTKAEGSPFLPRIYLELLRGTALTGLESVALNYFDFSDPEPDSSRLTLKLPGGSPLIIRADGEFYSSATGPFTLDILEETPLGNDDFTNAIEITGADVHLIGTTVGASREPDEPQPFSDGATVWWRWTAPATGTVILNGTNSQLFQLFHKLTFEAFSGTNLNDLTTRSQNYPIANAADACLYICYDALGTFRAEAGQSYYIRIGGYAGAAAPFDVHLTIVPAAPNDNFAEAAHLDSKTNLVVTGNNYGATREFGTEPYHLTDILGYQSVWWRWTAPVDGQARLTLNEQLINHLLAVYEVQPGSGQLLQDVRNQIGDSGLLLSSQVEFIAHSGREYFIAVDTLDGLGSAIEFTLEEIPTLELVPISLPDADGFHFVIRGGATNSFFIERSQDLKTWSSISTNQLANGRLDFVDPAPLPQGYRFYRAREE